MTYHQELIFAKDMAAQAGSIMKQYYRKNQQVEVKADHSPVTIADKTINQALIDQVQKHFPTHGVLGEEASWHEERDVVWVCDPIDGTVAYILHLPTSMFSLALVKNGQPVVAVAYNTWTDELYSAVRGGGAYRNDTPISVSHKPWGAGVRLMGSSGGAVEPVDAKRELLEARGFYISNVHGTVFKGCLVAEGSIEARGFMHHGAHDVAAVALLVTEAGGTVTDLNGKNQPYNQPVNGCVMTNGLVHNEFLKLVNS